MAVALATQHFFGTDLMSSGSTPTGFGGTTKLPPEKMEQIKSLVLLDEKCLRWTESSCGLAAGQLSHKSAKRCERPRSRRQIISDISGLNVVLLSTVAKP